MADDTEDMLYDESGKRVVPRLPLIEYQEKLESKGLDPLTGFEVPDDTEMAPPIGFIKQPSMMELIAKMVRSENLRQAAESAGFESFDEADDFDVDDEDGEPISAYQMEDGFEPIHQSSEVPTPRQPPASTPPENNSAPPVSPAAVPTPPAPGAAQ